MSVSPKLYRYSMFRRPVKEDDIRRLKNIQAGALLPVLLCLVFFLMTSNIYLLFLFLFLLIIGVLIPWILREILCSHLVLKQQLEGLMKQPASAQSPEEP